MRKVFKTMLLLLFVCLYAGSLTSCLGAKSIEKYGYVLTIGIDKGRQYKYNVSFLLESEVSSSEQQKTSTVNIISAEGDSIFDAIYIAEAGLPYRLNFSRTGYIAVSFDVASNNDVIEFFSTSWGMLKVRSSTNMVITQGTALEFISGLNYTSDVTVTKLANSLIDFYQTEGLTTIISVTEFMTAVESKRYDAVVPLGAVDESAQSTDADSAPSDTTAGVPRKGGMASYLLGAAIFSGENLCGVITGQETQILLLIQGKLNGAVYQFARDDRSTYSIRVGNLDAPEVKVERDGDKTHVSFDILVSVVLEQDSSQEAIDKMRETGQLMSDMQTRLKDFLEKSCTNLYTELQKLGSDSIGLGKYVSMKFDTVKEWEAFDFKNKLKNGNVTCSFNIEIELEDIYIASYME